MTKPIPFEDLNEGQRKYIIESLRKEVDYGRDKAWKIFSWVSTILIVITSALITLKFSIDPQKTTPVFSQCFKLLLIATVIVLCLYSILWILKNLTVEENAIKKIKAQEVGLGIRGKDEDIKPLYETMLSFFGYPATVFILCLAAIIAVYRI